MMLADNDYLHLRYSNELHAIKKLDLRRFIFRFNRTAVKMLGCFAGIDLFTGQSTNYYHQLKRRLATNPREPSMSPTYHLISHLIALLNIPFMLHILIDLIYQYSYDFDLLRLRRLKSCSNCSLSSGTNSGESINKLEIRLAETRAILYKLGAPHIHLSIRVECVQVGLVTFVILGTYFSQIFFRYFRKLDLHVIRDQLDYENENESVRQVIREKVEEYLESNRMFAVVLETTTCYYSRTNIHNILTQMLASGVLMPINRSLQWFDRRSRIVFIHHIVITVFNLMLFLGVFFLFIPRGHSARPLHLPDILITITSFGVGTIFASTCCFYVIYISAANLDQIHVANKLRALLVDCVRVNSRLYEASGSNIISREVMVKKVNTNLVFVLMQFKIFSTQHCKIRRSCEIVILFMTIFQFLIPLILKLHLPYFSLFNDSNRSLATIISLSTMVPTICVLVPLSYMHSQCVALYRVCACLMAHVAQIEYHARFLTSRDLVSGSIYDPHLIVALMKEMSNPEQFIKKFRPKIFGIGGAWISLLKIWAYFGLIVWLIIFDTRLESSHLFGPLFADPFGVFNE